MTWWSSIVQGIGPSISLVTLFYGVYIYWVKGDTVKNVLTQVTQV